MTGNELAAALQRRQAEAVEAARAEGRRQAAQAIVAHADRHAPADGNEAQRRMRRHLLIAARVAVGPPSMEQVAEALAAGNYMVCAVDEDGQTAAGHDFPDGCICYIREDLDWGEMYTRPDGRLCPVHDCSCGIGLTCRVHEPAVS